MNREQDKLDITAGKKILKANALEAEVQSAIVEYLEFHKIHFSVTNALETFNHKGTRVQRVYPAGTSDLIACTPHGRYLAIECKRAVGGVLSYEQAVFLKSVYLAQGLVCIARSVDDLVAVLMSGNRKQDLDEIAVALAKGPDVKGLMRRKARTVQRNIARRIAR